MTGDVGEEVFLAFAEVALEQHATAAAAAEAAAAAPPAAAAAPEEVTASSRVLSVKCTLDATGRATARVYLRGGSVPLCN